MKNKLFDNLGLKILAVIFAIILWLVVMNVSDYAITVKIDDIPVVQLNGDALSELDQIYDVTKGNTVDIIIKGRRSIVDSLDIEDFVATADLSTMSITNTVQIFVEPKNKNLSDEINITYVDNTMTLSLEDKISEQFPVTVKTLGTVKEKYAVCTTITTPNIITVEGPKTAVSKVKRAEVEVNVDEKTECFETKSKVTLYDAYDEVIKNDKLQLSDEEIKLKVDIYPIKTVSVEVTCGGEPAMGYLVSDILFQPQTIEVAGAPDILKGLKKISINGVSVDGIRKNYEDVLDVTDYLPEGVTLAQTSKDIAVTVVVEKATSITLKPVAADFELLNQSELSSYDIVPLEDFSIVVTGLDKDVKNFNKEDLNLKIDCTELYYGLYEDVTVYMDEIKDLEFELTGQVNVEVSEAKETSEATGEGE